MKPGKYATTFKGKKIPLYYVTEKSEAEKYLKILSKKERPIYAIDTETRALQDFTHISQAALSPHLSTVRLIQIYGGDDAFVFDCDAINENRIFREMLERETFVGHNAVFDIQYFYKWFRVQKINIGCTYLAARLLMHATRPTDEGLSASLKNLVNIVFGEEIIKEMQVSNWGEPDLTFEQVEYSALDAIATYYLAMELAPRLKKFGLERVYKLYKDAQHPIAKMQLNGITLDVDAHRKQIDIWRQDLSRARKALVEMTGLDSITPAKIGKYLEKSLPPEVLVVWPRTETGKLATDSHVFSDFDFVDIVKPFTEFQKYTKLCSSFGNTLIDQINPATGRIHPRFNLCGARTGRLSCSNPNCFTGETEILTTNGWRRFDLITYEDRIAQWNAGVISFVAPSSIVKTCAQSLVSLNNEHIALDVTPDHRCLLRNRKTGHLRVFSALEYPEDWHQLNAATYGGGTLYMPKSFLGLLIATQADGSWHDGGIDFVFVKRRKYLRLLRYLKDLDAPFSIHTPTRSKPYRVRVLKSETVENIFRYLGPTKIFSNWILNITRELLDFFSDEVFYWDGLYTRRNNYSSCVEENADWVQIAQVLSGRRTNIRRYNYLNYSTSYQTDVTYRDYSGTTNISKKYILSKVPVYCVTVPSSYIMIRCRGKVCITGNCQQLPRDSQVRKSIIASDSNVFVLADYSSVEVRAAAELSCDAAMLRIFERGEDIYKATAAGLRHKKLEDVTKEERQLAKAQVLGLQFGLGKQKLSHYVRRNYKINISEEDASKQVDAYRKLYPDFRKWQLDVVDKAAKENFTSRTPTGKLRKYEPGAAFGNVMNHYCQGSCAEAMLYALVDLHSKLPKGAGLVLSVHDEIVVESSLEKSKEVSKLLEDSMIKGYLNIFPSGKTIKGLVKATSGVSWAEAKG